MTQSKKLLCKIISCVLLIVDISEAGDPHLLWLGSSTISVSHVPLAIIQTMVGMVTEAKGPWEFPMQVVSI